jgi:uncharacterized membrane protein YphA (DoxX/SURF4 family)
MLIITQALQVVIAIVLLVTWTVNFNRATMFRGGDAKSMKEEFAVYGLPMWSVYVVGGLKILASLALLAGLAYPAFVFPGALVIVVLMVGAFAMHLKIRDTAVRTFPSAFILTCSLIVLASTIPA